MANRGATFESLASTLAHEIGHTLGLRHVDDINGGSGAGSTQDPSFMVGASTPNLMWAGGSGPSYNSSLDNDPNLTVQQENNHLNSQQIAAAIHNGLALDPDGNGVGVIQLLPEPSSVALLGLGSLAFILRRRK